MDHKAMEGGPGLMNHGFSKTMWMAKFMKTVVSIQLTILQNLKNLAWFQITQHTFRDLLEIMH